MLSSLAMIRSTANSGVFLDYYDVAYNTCKIDANLEKRLGLKKILLSDSDLKVMDANSKGNIEGSIFMASGEQNNLLDILNRKPNAVAFTDLIINKKALEQMEDKGITLFMPLSIITMSYGLQRSRKIYMMKKLFTHANKIKLNASFATLAKSNIELCSYMQIVELAKLVGADEDYARKSLSEINKSLVVK
jgi:hypothetical protein